jgi:hypothetical protein
MGIPCSRCGGDTEYVQGPGHLWSSTCNQCGAREEGTLSPATEPMPELAAIVKCHIQLHDPHKPLVPTRTGEAPLLAA